MGRMLAQTMIRQQVARNSVNTAGGYRGSFSSSGKYLFVAHPNCCPKCTQMNGTLWNTPDVAFISHPNCKCATIEAPAGLSPADLMAWTKNPVGVMRFGFNYGESLKPVQLTVENRDKVYAQWRERMDPESVKAHPRRLVRAKVSQAQIDAIRAKVESGELTQGVNLTRRIQGLVDAQKTRALKRTEAGKVAEKVLGGVNRAKIVDSQKSAKLRKGKTWNPNTSAMARLNRGNTVVMPRNGYGSEAEAVRKLSPKASNVEFSAALMGAARLLKGSRSKAMKAYTDRIKERKRREKEEVARLKKIGLL